MIREMLEGVKYAKEVPYFSMRRKNFRISSPLSIIYTFSLPPIEKKNIDSKDRDIIRPNSGSLVLPNPKVFL